MNERTNALWLTRSAPTPRPPPSPPPYITDREPSPPAKSPQKTHDLALYLSPLPRPSRYLVFSFFFNLLHFFDYSYQRHLSSVWCSPSTLDSFCSQQWHYRLSVTAVVTLPFLRPASASPTSSVHYVDSTDVTITNSFIMDPSQHHQHHHPRNHHKSLSQQQSSSSLSMTARPTPPLYTHLPPSASMPLRTANSTPMSSPGLFSPSGSRQNLYTSVSESNTPINLGGSPLLHPLQMHRVRE